jgi:hypothetical protein
MVLSVQTLAAQPIELAWDPGVDHAGTEAISQPDTLGGRYSFRLLTANPGQDDRRWLIKLKFETWEAHLYLHNGSAFATKRFSQRTDKSGSVWLEGHASTTFKASFETFEIGAEKGCTPSFNHLPILQLALAGNSNGIRSISDLAF